jgi:hypothetical protein
MEETKGKLASPVLLGILVLVLIVVVSIASKFVPWSGNLSPAPTAMKTDPNVEFIKQMAQKCQGDITRLSPEEQQAVVQKCGNFEYARQALMRYGNKP